MNASATHLQQVRGLDRLRAHAVVLALFSGTMFLSALLLFSVQPVFAKMVLPKLGGSPSVWAISMCFFQAVLLAGYCYAHVLNRWIPIKRTPLVHLGLLSAATLALPFGLPVGVEPPAGDAYVWLIGVLAVGVGLPFFAVSANAPLLQAWFARSGHPQANDPYFLYGASNLGSLVALLAYPVAIEPVLGLAVQSRIWSVGFVLLGWLIAASGLVMLLCAADAVGRPAAATVARPQEAVTWGRRLQWIGLSLVPSGLLVAFTSYVTTDVASAPFVWVIPLAMFLATFIAVFREQPMISHQLLLLLQPGIVAITFIGLALTGPVGWLIASATGVLAFFVTTMVAHRELYERRPASGHLTEFYLWMSFGGVLGGVFAAIVSPQIFNALYELPLLLLCGLCCRPGFGLARASRAERVRALWLAIGGLGLVLGLLAAVRLNLVAPVAMQTPTLFVLIGCGAAMQLLRERVLAVSVATAVTTLCLLLLPNAMNQGESERSFFGVHRIVVEQMFDADGTYTGEIRSLLHGTTMHGMERTKDASGQPITGAPVPSSYYHPDSPMFHALAAARTAFVARDGGRPTIGIVGLGAGSMTCHAKPGETWRIFEIDPVVASIARSRFSYLRHCLPGDAIVLGDARLTLAKEPNARFDYIMIDAFSSDSIPVHLLTREAIALYVDKLAPGGVLALHISNRHLDLLDVTNALVASIPGLRGINVADRRVATAMAAPSLVVVIARSGEVLAPVLALPGASGVPATSASPWTDDYSNVLGALIANYWK